MPDTIAAIATAAAPAAIGILRLSGPEAVSILDKVFSPLSGPPMAARPDRALVYGALRDGNGRELDRCLATVSRAPRSYTGEDTAELQCHGSPALLALALERLFAAGARQARAGEFTQRAFLNGRLDLTQAEAVADLIDAKSPAAVRSAAGQLSGRLSASVDAVYNTLTDLMAHFHAVLDYPDEDIDPFEAATIRDALDEAGESLKLLLSTYERGKYIRDGLPCAIVGRPNAGKSTLFNALLGYDRAIVTDIPGTTRDTVEETCLLGGVLLRLIDTAGLRDTDDAVEKLGVERSLAALEGAALALVLTDPGAPASPEDGKLLREAMARAERVILLRTKADLYPDTAAVSSPDGPRMLSVSAKTGLGLAALEQEVAALFPTLSGRSGGAEVLLANARQAEAAGRAVRSLDRAKAALADGVSPDAVLTDVEEAMAALAELTGRSVRADVTERIFSRFCVGK